MKLPLYTVIGPPLRKNYRTIKKLCSFPLLNISSSYACFLGILGAALSIIDIVRIVNCGPVLPQTLWRNRIQSGKVVSPQCERDLKLMSLVLSFEYYLFLVLGTFMVKKKNAALFLPWLLLYSFIIVLEFANFVFKLFFEGLSFTKHSLILSIFIIYNWLAIFCAFTKLMGICDYYY